MTDVLADPPGLSLVGVWRPRQVGVMERRTLFFIALALTMVYGLLFVVVDNMPRTYTVIGAVVVALTWIAVGTFGRTNRRDERPLE